MLFILDTLKLLSPHVLLGLEAFSCLVFIYFFHRFLGVAGLYAYGCIALLLGNIQVLKLGVFPFLDQPVALGTILFTSTYFVSDILTEHHGPGVAKKMIPLGFLTLMMAPLLMMFSIALPCAPDSTFCHRAMQALFMPLPRFLFASFISYALSQWLDITLFQRLKTQTRGRWVWFRSGFSSLMATFCDHVVFSYLAFMLLSPHPVDAKTLWSTYIMGTYAIRVVAGLGFSPCLYFFQRSHHDTNHAYPYPR